MRGTELLDKMELVEPMYVEAAKTAGAGGRARGGWVKWVAVAACLCIAVGVIAHLLGQGNTPLELELSDKTTARVELGIPVGVSVPQAEYDLVYFTEEEMFSREDQYIFRGTVRSLTNITIDFNGFTEYACIAVIDVSKVYKGDIHAGEQLRMLIHSPVGLEGYWQEDTSTISQIKVAMEGIFMTWTYDDDSFWEENGAVLILRDLASCGLADGERWAFLSDGEQLIYADWAYPGAGGSTLDDIEAYVLRMLDSVS